MNPLRPRSPRSLRFAAFLLPIACATHAVLAQDPAPTRPWSDVADFSLILTTGNSETTNFAFSNKYAYKWTESELTIDAAALRTETTTRTLSNPNGVVLETNTKATTAESYALGGKYRHTIHERLFWYGAVGWMRNRFAGVQDRTSGGGGVGYRFIKTDVHSLVGEAGADFTDETQVGGASDSFAGARAYLAYERNLSKTSKFNTDLELLENLDDTDDLRAKWVTSLTASLTAKTALKVSYTTLYDKQPVELLVAPDATAPPGTPSALFEFDDLDTILAASVVVNF
jgi:putative salt-induced outer membrane protein YdiY